MSKLVCGKGINDLGYQVEVRETISDVGEKQKQKLLWRCPYYQVWTNMLNRCYSEKYKDLNKAYNGVVVCEEWHLFSNFKRWMETQNWKGNHLDKDLLSGYNKIYSPETCCFLPSKINLFIVQRVGVDFDKRRQKYRARCSDETGKNRHLGYFDSYSEANCSWGREKSRVAKILAEQIENDRISQALLNKFKYEEDISE